MIFRKLECLASAALLLVLVFAAAGLAQDKNGADKAAHNDANANNTATTEEPAAPAAPAEQPAPAAPAEQPAAPAAPAEQPAAPAAPPKAAGPLVSDLLGISLGMTADDIKHKLGKPDTGDKTSMYFDLDNGQAVQVRLDGDKKAAMVAVIYTGREAKAPDHAEVLGPDVTVVPKDNGSIYKLVRYPAQGYWVSYSRLNLDSGPMTTVTIQKIQGTE